jgi:hypothetical protein
LSEKYKIYTLVDITDSGVTDPKLSESTEYNQAQNLNVLLQIIGMRTQPMDHQVTCLRSQKLSDFSFGKTFKGKSNIWCLEFTVENQTPWMEEEDPLYHLRHDLEGMVFVGELSNTKDFKSDVFVTSGDYCNIIFEKE